MTADDFCHDTFMAFEMHQSHFSILLMGVDSVALPNEFSVREGNLNLNIAKCEFGQTCWTLLDMVMFGFVDPQRFLFWFFFWHGRLL